MSMLVMCDTEYLKKEKFYWVKFIVCNAMLGIYVKYMILFVVLSCFLSLVMGRKRKITKKLVVPTAPMVEKPLKIYHTTEAFYLDHLRSLCARAGTPTSLIEGKSLDEHACYV